MNWLSPMAPIMRRADNSKAASERKRRWRQNPENYARELREKALRENEARRLRRQA